MCGHDKKDKRLLERATEDIDEPGAITRQGEQLVECRRCGSTDIRHRKGARL